MKVDNFEIIRGLMNFRTDDDFYFCQILQRKKENPSLPKSVKLIKTFYIDSFEKLDGYEHQIKKLCVEHNARAYINLNRRSYRKVALGVLKKIAGYISEDTFKPVKNVYDSVCGQLLNENSESKKWVLDYDRVSLNSEERGLVQSTLINELKHISPEGMQKVYATIPTLNGFHLICRPFNCTQFKEIFPHIEIHKNNPTILTA